MVSINMSNSTPYSKRSTSNHVRNGYLTTQCPPRSAAPQRHISLRWYGEPSQRPISDFLLSRWMWGEERLLPGRFAQWKRQKKLKAKAAWRVVDMVINRTQVTRFCMALFFIEQVLLFCITARALLSVSISVSQPTERDASPKLRGSS